MRHLERILAFAPRSLLVLGVVTTLILVFTTYAYYLIGLYLPAGVCAVLLFIDIYLQVLQIRGRWHHRQLIKLRQQLVRALKRQLAGTREIHLLISDEKKAVFCERRWFIAGWRYTVMAGTLDDESELDWNVAFSQRHGVSRLQIFHFPPLLNYVEQDIWLAASPEDLPEDDMRSKLSADYVKSRLRELGMDATYAGESELRWLLRLIKAGVPMEHEEG